MQYPIIDNLIYAYLCNGWTGLNLVNNANFNIFELFPGYYASDGSIVDNSPNGERYILDFIDISNYRTVTLNYYNYPAETAIAQFYWKSICVYDENKNLIERFALSTPNPFTINITSRYKYIRFSLRTYNMGNEYIYLSFNNNQSSGFSDNTKNLTDFQSRLKLPLPHYFPHPVIDALISAADGQQTEEENEILRHYLTPLGIGGI